AHGLGIWRLHPDEKMTGRSHPIFINYGGSFLPSFPLRMALAVLREKPKQAVIEENRISLKGRHIPLVDGKMLITFRNGQSPFRKFSFVDILKAKKTPSLLKGRIILIGFRSSGDPGINTPLSTGMSENHLAAHALDGILNSRFISRPALLGVIEMLAMIILACFAALYFPPMTQPIRLAWTAGLTIIVLVIGAALFSFMKIWFKPVHVIAPLIIIYAVFSLKQLLTAERVTKESIETNRLLGLSFQSQGLLDLAFDKFRKLPLDNETKDLIYNLGLEYERKRMINKAISVFEYVIKAGPFRDLDDRIPRLKESDKSSTMGSHGKLTESSILEDTSAEKITMIGRYEVLGELGKGSMGLVYKAMDPKINRLLAIKTIRFSDEFDEDVIHEIKERFFREAEIAGKLSHPSIVIIYDVGEFRDLTYMAMEFLEGEDLENFITRKNLLPFRKVLDIVAHVAEALEFAHKDGVIHRDIKPANIMLLKTGGVKVTDFGIAKAISSSRTKTGVILGTPNYMSPEQIMGQKIDHRSDIFSLGVLFYQLLTGDTPFHGDNLSNLLYQITQVKHPSIRTLNSKIPKICEQIIDKSLAKNPDQRFKNAADMAKYIRILASKMDQLREKKIAQG
ncbi:MAG: protein kinase, partial [Deltaproteobacteria bacterium]|nr:protein kinase [Deltaproteobacteria bacterium]